MDDSALKGRLIAAGLGVVGFGIFWAIFLHKSEETENPDSEVHKALIAEGCEAGGQERGTPGFENCVKRAAKECTGSGGVGRNLAVCAKVIATQE